MVYNNPYFDVKTATLGAAIMGPTVFLINYYHGTDSAYIAAAKQAAYTFLVGGSMIRMCENLTTSFKNPKVSKAMAVIIPSAITFGLTYGIHSLKGTLRPFVSSIPTLLLAPPAFAFIARRKIRQLERLAGEKEE
jgi:hypothetical protein